MPKSKVSLIIPTMNRFNSLKNTIESLLSCVAVSDEIVIIDQSSKKEISFLINNYIKGKSSILYSYQDLPSLTKARNKGLEFVKNDIVIFADDDIEVNQDTLSNIISIMKDEHISMIAGINELEGKSRSILGYLFGFKSFSKRKIGHIAPAVFGRFPTNIKGQTDTMWAMGFFFVVRKSLVDKWGLSFDEHFTSYAYAEDLDFSYSYYKKSKEEGYKCIISDKVVVRHLNSQEYRIPSRKSTFMYVLHRAYIYKKHNFPFRYWIMLNVANRVMLLKRIIKKENPEDMKDAIRYLKHHKKEVFSGNFYYGE